MQTSIHSKARVRSIEKIQMNRETFNKKFILQEYVGF